MASIRERKGKFNVIYNYKDDSGKRKQKWETYDTKAEAKKRKREIEYKQEMGSLVVRKCNTLSDLLTEYVSLYGKEKWALSTYEGNVSLIRNYIEPMIGTGKKGIAKRSGGKRCLTGISFAAQNQHNCSDFENTKNRKQYP